MLISWLKKLTKIKFINSFCLLSFFILTAHAVNQKPIVVIIPSYNNAAWCVKNIESVLKQKYTNYRVVYVDDCSTDGTYEIVKNKVAELHAAECVQIIHNQSRRGALANIYTAVHNCAHNEIIALVDGDDWLAHDQVLETVNNAYQDPNIWMTYGQFKVHPDNRIGECKDIPKGISRGNYYREYDWCTSHLRTFYAGLFKQIKLQDLIFNGIFFEVTWDMAMLFPMLEMSGGRFICIKDVLYIYNCANEANDFKTKLLLQIHCNKLISSKTKYAPLNPTALSIQEMPTVSLLMMSNDNPIALQEFLSTLGQHALGLDTVCVVYGASTHEMQERYAVVQKNFPQYIFEQSTQSTFKSMMTKQLKTAKKYIVLAHDGIVLKDAIRFYYCAQALDHTHALGFYFNLGKQSTMHKSLERAQELPAFIALDADTYAWQFADGEYAWRTPFTCDMAMYRADVVARLCENCRYDSWQSLEQAFLAARVDLQAIGLMHENSKVFNRGC